MPSWFDDLKYQLSNEKFKQDSAVSDKNPTGAPMIGNAHVDDFTMAMGALARMFGRNSSGADTAYSKAGSDVEQMGATNKQIRLKEEEPANLMAKRHYEELQAAVERERSKALASQPSVFGQLPQATPIQAPGVPEPPAVPGVGQTQEDYLANYANSLQQPTPQAPSEFPTMDVEGRMEAAKKLASMTPLEKQTWEAQQNELAARTKLLGVQTTDAERMSPLNAQKLQGEIDLQPVQRQEAESRMASAKAEADIKTEQAKWIGPQAQADLAYKKAEINHANASAVAQRASASLHTEQAKYYKVLKDAGLDEKASARVTKAYNDVATREAAAEKALIDPTTGRMRKDPTPRIDLGKSILQIGVSQALDAARGSRPDAAMGMVAKGTIQRGLDHSLMGLNQLSANAQQRQLIVLLNSLEGIRRVAPNAYQTYVDYIENSLAAPIVVKSWRGVKSEVPAIRPFGMPESSEWQPPRGTPAYDVHQFISNHLAKTGANIDKVIGGQ